MDTDQIERFQYANSIFRPAQLELLRYIGRMEARGDPSIYERLLYCHISAIISETHVIINNLFLDSNKGPLKIRGDQEINYGPDLVLDKSEDGKYPITLDEVNLTLLYDSFLYVDERPASFMRFKQFVNQIKSMNESNQAFVPDGSKIVYLNKSERGYE